MDSFKKKNILSQQTITYPASYQISVYSVSSIGNNIMMTIKSWQKLMARMIMSVKNTSMVKLQLSSKFGSFLMDLKNVLPENLQHICVDSAVEEDV